MALYHKPGLAALGLCAPTLVEAEVADAELCGRSKACWQRSFTLDEATHEAVVVRDSLQLWLQPRPKPLAPMVDKPPHAAPYQKGKGKGKLAAGLNSCAESG